MKLTAEELINKHLELIGGKYQGIKDGNVYEACINAINEAINYIPCCTELNHDFKKGDDVWITSKTLVTIADFTECGKRVQVEDGCDYYLVDIEDLTKVV